MGVICDICNRDMKVTDGCNKAEIIYKGAMALLSGDVNFIFDE